MADIVLLNGADSAVAMVVVPGAMLSNHDHIYTLAS